MQISSETELAGAIAGASGALKIEGGGTRRFGDVVAGDILTTRGLSGITLYEPGALTLVVRAGTPLAEVEDALAAKGQRLAFEPMDHRGLSGQDGTPTIGGVVAANVSGPRRIQAGACRDFLLGVRFVDGQGRIIKNGGRVMKNVTGYDLVKLMAGSFGTLGVLSELSLKVLPRPEAAAVLMLGGLSDARAIEALSAALASPFDVTGAAHGPLKAKGAPVTLIRLEGFGASVAERAAKLERHLADFGQFSVETSAAVVGDIWAGVRDVAAFHGRAGDVWRISVKPTDGPRAGAALRASFGAEVQYDWGGGLVWALLPEGADARAPLAGIAGQARLERASPQTKAALGTFAPQMPVIDTISAGLRARFDPRGILNPGLMGNKD